MLRTHECEQKATNQPPPVQQQNEKKESFDDYLKIEKDRSDSMLLIEDKEHSFMEEHDNKAESFMNESSSNDPLGSPKMNYTFENKFDFLDENEGLWREEGVGWLSKPDNDYGVFCKSNDLDLNSESDYLSDFDKDPNVSVW